MLQILVSPRGRDFVSRFTALGTISEKIPFLISVTCKHLNKGLALLSSGQCHLQHSTTLLVEWQLFLRRVGSGWEALRYEVSSMVSKPLAELLSCFKAEAPRAQFLCLGLATASLQKLTRHLFRMGMVKV